MTSTLTSIYILGKKYEVPADATIMGAMEYAGYKLVRGCGCRHGFCGACAVVYRIKDKRELRVALACHTQVADGMYIATIPFFPFIKQIYDINDVRPNEQIMMRLYPEIYSCIGCNACTKACPQELPTMQYIAHAQRAEYAEAAKKSFPCVMCGICSARCPAGISHPQVGVLCRRLYGKYIAKATPGLAERVMAIESGDFEAEFDAVMSGSLAEIKEKYNTREIEE
ncbi:MAG: 4Fe-4S dicluster domain-containing protein [Defluviitaleaceae bacterium]|nr:4Fe-4S dicluster domain-containing protein [Defluviitaleaceae bacterium]